MTDKPISGREFFKAAAEALRSEAPYRRPTPKDHPKPGWYWTRLVKGGPKIPIRITATEVVRGNKPNRVLFEVFVGDQEVVWTTVWPDCSANKLTEKEHRYLLEMGRWTTANDPDAPEANPRKKINLHDMPPLF